MVRHYIRKRAGLGYSSENLLAAMKEVKAGATLSAASQRYGIPRSTIRNKILRGVRSTTKGGRTALPPSTEQKIVASLYELEKAGLELSRDEFRDLIQDHIRENGLVTRFKDDRPGDEWFHSFRKRHNLSLKVSRRVEVFAKHETKAYFSRLKKNLEDLSLIDKPGQVYSMYETSFRHDSLEAQNTGKKRGRKPKSENTTVLAACSATGQKIPPLIVFTGKKVCDTWHCQDTAPQSIRPRYAATLNGSLKGPLFRNYFEKTFVTNIGPQRPILLIFDGQNTHLDIDFVTYAMSQQISILKLPLRSSHLLQPLESAVFESMKTLWGQQLMGKNPGENIPKASFAKLLGQVWTQTSPETITSGFRKTGIVPFNDTVIPDECYEKESVSKYFKSLTVQAPYGSSTSNSHERPEVQSHQSVAMTTSSDEEEEREVKVELLAVKEEMMVDDSEGETFEIVEFPDSSGVIAGEDVASEDEKSFFVPGSTVRGVRARPQDQENEQDIEVTSPSYGEPDLQTECDEDCTEATSTTLQETESPATKKQKSDQTVKQTPNTSKEAETTNECALFCELLCLKLKALDSENRELAMHEINNLMFSFKRPKGPPLYWSQRNASEAPNPSASSSSGS